MNTSSIRRHADWTTGLESALFVSFLVVATFIFVYPNVWLGNGILCITCAWFTSKIISMPQRIPIETRDVWCFSWALLVFALSFFAYVPIGFLQDVNGEIDWDLATYFDLTAYFTPIGRLFHPEAFNFEPAGIPGQAIVETTSIFRTDFFQYPVLPIPSYPNLMRLGLSSFCIILGFVLDKINRIASRAPNHERDRHVGMEKQRQHKREASIGLGCLFAAPLIVMMGVVGLNSRSVWIGTGFMCATLGLTVLHAGPSQSTGKTKCSVCLFMCLLTVAFGFYFQQSHYFPAGKGIVRFSASFKLPYELYYSYLEFIEPDVNHPRESGQLERMKTDFAVESEGFITSFHFSVPTATFTRPGGKPVLFSNGNYLNFIRVAVCLISLIFVMGITLLASIFHERFLVRRERRTPSKSRRIQIERGGKE